jgi:hypothetical protein
MVVTAFAGCASGVKQEAFDGLEDRVEALEGAINGVKDSVDNIQLPDNKEILDAIKDVQTNLENKIESVNGRVEELEKEPVVTPGNPNTPDAAAIAAAQAALAKIEVKRGEFQKNAAEYTEADYAKILEALGAATSAVNAANTAAEVETAMKNLDATLAQYMTYAMKAYDYYEQLLGNLTAESKDLIAEVEDFLKAVKKYYKNNVEFTGKLDATSYDEDEIAGYKAELAYLVSEGTTEAKDVYLDVYTALENFVSIFNGTSKKLTSTTKIYYVTEKGKLDAHEFAALVAYEKEAEALVDLIEDAVGDELIYMSEGFDDLADIITRYEDYAEIAELLGGQALLDLVTNADKITEAEDAYDNLVEAADAYDKATKYGRLKTDVGSVFYYYDELVKDGYVALLEYEDDDEDIIRVSEVFAEVDAILNDWVETFDLSEENMLAIIEAKEGTKTYYTDEAAKSTTGKADTYVARKHYNALLEAAAEEFKAEIADLIADLNDTDTVSVQLVLDYNEIVELIEDLKVTQEADKTATYPANIALADISDANMAIIYKDADLFEEFADERLDAIKGIIDLFTFKGDVDQLEDTKVIIKGEPDDDNVAGDEADIKINEVYFDDEDDNRAYGDIYTFLTKTYEQEIKPAADKINEAIEALVEDVEDKAIADNEAFILLGGEYLVVKAGDKYGDETFAKDVYVLVEDYFDDDDAYEAYMDAKAADSSIAAFEYHYEEFKDMIDTAAFEAAQKTITDRVNKLFTEIDEIVALVEAVDYVRDGAIIYVDADKDGMYDEGEEVDETVKAIVSLNDAAAVKAAVNAYNEWVYAGGSTDIAYFAAYVDADEYTYDDVYEMVGLENVDEINKSLATLKSLDTAILKLEEQATQFVAAVNNALAVHKANPFRADLDENHLVTISGNGGSVKYWSWTKRTLSTAEDAKDNEGSYTFVAKSSVYKTNTGNSYTAKKGEPYAWLASVTLTKQDLLAKIVELYDAFKLANVEYKADADNDYEADEYYYQAAEYAAYKAFDDAVKSYEALDLLSVKGYLLASVADTDDATHSFRAQINGATTLAALQNAVYQYNVSATTKITAADLDAIAIYDFTRLNYAI